MKCNVIVPCASPLLWIHIQLLLDILSYTVAVLTRFHETSIYNNAFLIKALSKVICIGMPNRVDLSLKYIL